MPTGGNTSWTTNNERAQASAQVVPVASSPRLARHPGMPRFLTVGADTSVTEQVTAAAETILARLVARAFLNSLRSEPAARRVGRGLPAPEKHRG